jgi:hypothetical protein
MYCTNLASEGYVVVCLEHRDGSAPFTLINPPQGDSINLEHVNYKNLQ